MRKQRALDATRVGGALCIGLATMSAGCGFVSPGDYRMYKMSITESTKQSGCFYPDSADPNTQSDTDTKLDNAMWVLTVDTSDNYFLDIGDHTLKGAEADDGFKFDERKVDVQFEGNDAKKTKRTTTVATRVSFTVDGKSIGGTYTTTTSFACDGSNCGPGIPDCVESGKFSGTQVDDVQLHYIVK